MNSTNITIGASKNQQLELEAVDLAATAASFCNDNILPVMEALVQLATFDSPDLIKNRMRIDLIKSLAQVGRQLVEEAAGHMETEVRERQDALAVAGGAQ